MTTNGSGKRVIFNTLEMILSTDLNRLQAFAAADLGETLRGLLNTLFPYDGPEATFESTGTPLEADVISGLMVIPSDDGTGRLWVTPGVLGCLDPNNPVITDDSPYKLVVDGGMSLANTTLSLIANGTTTDRWDVIEAARIDSIAETDNRNIYNTATGLFTPSTVSKVGHARLTYRIRLGVSGSGLPSPAAGWCPLAVIRVPQNTSALESCWIFDVRPLLADRQDAPFKTDTAARDSLVQSHISAQSAGTGTTPLEGYAEACIGGYRVGGQIVAYNVTAGVNDSTIPMGTADPNGKDYRSQAAISSGALYHVYVCMPAGFHRFRLYTTPTATSPRRPGCWNGVLVISQQMPDQYGRHSAVLLPNFTTGGNLNFGGQTAPGVCLGSSFYTSATNAGSILVQGRKTLIDKTASPSGAGRTLTNANQSAVYAYTAGSTTFPANARAIYVDITATFTTSTAPGPLNTAVYAMFAAAGPNVTPDVPSHATFQLGTSVTNIPVVVRARIALPEKTPADPTAARTFNFRWDAVANGTLGGDQVFTTLISSCVVTGWEV